MRRLVLAFVLGASGATALGADATTGAPGPEAVALAPRLFSLCGQAQGAASRLAVAAAMGEVLPTGALLRGVVLEAIGEHLRRLLLDWPTVHGLPPEKDVFMCWRKRLLSAKCPEDEFTFTHRTMISTDIDLAAANHVDLSL